MIPAILGVASLGLQIRGNRKAKRALRRQAERDAEEERKAAEATAKQLEAKAKDERMIGSYQIEDQALEGESVESRAKALGAASGAGGYQGAIADVEAESEYRAFTSLYNSDRSARDLEIAARLTREHGANVGTALRERAREQSRASDIETMTGVLSGAMSLYERFGQGGIDLGGGTTAPSTLDASTRFGSRGWA